ncbi:fatty acyl-AMP ligase [Mycobacterium sp. NPDC050853]|uniref:fatty acyl-AMP ligase n=1 Tax=Mycobacteriaceae TaxID=1762 RepID=UPI0015DE62B9|nr:AMP-binding protein [Mycobacteroides sp. LB1]
MKSLVAGLRVEEYLDETGAISLPDGYTVNHYLECAVDGEHDTFAYRYVDFSNDPDGEPNDLNWPQLRARSRAVAARLQQVTKPGDRVAILAPQGLDYVIGFFAAIEAGNIAVPLFAPELPGHTERLDAVLTDAQPTVVLTNEAAAESVSSFVRRLPRERRPRIVAVDGVPDSVGATYVPVTPDTDDIAYLQYTSGSTRVPAGVEITHRAVMTNVLQMVISVGLDVDVRGASWLPLYHDMGLLMLMFPLCGGRMTLMSPMSFVRRPGRWIQELAAAAHLGRTFGAAPNFAFELAAERGLPKDDQTLDLSNVAGLINGSEPVSISSIRKFNEAFGPYGLPPTAIKPSYGMAEATLFVSSIAPDAEPSVIYMDREQLGAGHAARVDAADANAVPQVSCGQIARSQWAVIVHPNADSELPDGQVGEIWLHGNNIGRGYWGRPEETDLSFRNKLQARLDEGSHADGTEPGASWFRTGDLGVYVDGELYITGRVKDLVIVDGRNHYPQDIEATVEEASPAVRRGFVAAFSVPAGFDAGDGFAEKLVIVAERAAGAGRAEPGPVIVAIRAAVSRRHTLPIADVQLVPAGAIPRTSSGKIARRACRQEYLDNKIGTHGS